MRGLAAIAFVLPLIAPSTTAAQIEEALGLGAGEDADTEAAQAPQLALEVEDRARLDRRIETQLAAVFSQVEELTGVEVAVRSGVVHLDGTIESAEVRDRARTLARGLEGVLFVDDDTEVETDVSERVRPAVQRAEQAFRDLIRRLPLVGLALGIIAAAALLARLLTVWDLPFRLVARHRLARGVVRQLVVGAIMIGAVLLALDLLDATALVGAVLGAAGLLGLALGFAFRDIAENYLASVLLGLRRPFAINDFVCIDGVHEGIVLALSTRDTVLITLDGNHVRVPNASVYKSVIVNYTRNPKRRFGVVVGIGNTEDLVRAQAIGVRALREMESVLEEPAPFALVEELGASSVQVRFHAWMDQRHHDWLRARSEGTRRVKVALELAGIDLPVPIQRIELSRAARPEGASGRGTDHEEHSSVTGMERDESFAGQVREEQARSKAENLL